VLSIGVDCSDTVSNYDTSGHVLVTVILADMCE